MICVRAATLADNLCASSGPGACWFKQETMPIVIDPSCSSQLVLLKLDEMPPPITPYDYSQGAAFFSFGLTSVLVLYLASHAIGLVIKSVRIF